MTQPKKTQRYFSPEFKLEAIEQVVKYQQTTTAVARALEIEPGTLRKWIRQYKAEVSGITPDNPALTAEQREIQALRKRIQRLEMEKEILKQAAVLMSETPVKFCMFSVINNAIFIAAGSRIRLTNQPPVIDN